MAFLRFSRDKRGYEHFCLVQPSARGKSRPRVLYWFRTPPNVKVGRVPFDPEIRRALETQYPGVMFDWKVLERTPPPPPDVERWRERRRIERAMREAAQAEEPEADAPEPHLPTAIEAMPPGTEIEPELLTDEVVGAMPAADAGSASNLDVAPASAAPTASAGRGPRRRRRGRRRGRSDARESPGPRQAGSGPEPPSGEAPEARIEQPAEPPGGETDS